MIRAQVNYMDLKTRTFYAFLTETLFDKRANLITKQIFEQTVLACRDFAKSLTSKNLKFSIVFPDEIPDSMFYAQSFEMVLQNLLQNAVTHAREGTNISIFVTFDKQLNQIKTSIINEGDMIPLGDQENMF